MQSGYLFIRKLEKKQNNIDIMAAAGGGGSGANPKADDAFSKFMTEVV